MRSAWAPTTLSGFEANRSTAASGLETTSTCSKPNGRALGHVEARGRPAKMQFLSDDDKAFQGADIHGRTPLIATLYHRRTNFDWTPIIDPSTFGT